MILSVPTVMSGEEDEAEGPDDSPWLLMGLPKLLSLPTLSLWQELRSQESGRWISKSLMTARPLVRSNKPNEVSFRTA